MTNTDYWARQAKKHRRMAMSLRAKFGRTGEVRWARQAASNDESARRIERSLMDALTCPAMINSWRPSVLAASDPLQPSNNQTA